MHWFSIRFSSCFLLAVALLPASLMARGARAQSTADAAPARTTLTSQGYELQTGDSIELLYRITPEYNQTVNVLPDGTVSLLLLGSVPVRGLTLDQAKARILVEAVKHLNQPELSLSLHDYEKPHFTVLGEVANPGRFELRGPLTTVDGVAMAGGLKLAARHTQIVLVHRVNDSVGAAELLDLKQFEKKTPRGTELVPLRDGDIVIVPTSRLSKIERLVKLANLGVYYNPPL